VSYGKYPILIQGETSTGKTSLIRYLAALTGNKVVRINNHEHTDLQEYIGSYASDKEGELAAKSCVCSDPKWWKSKLQKLARYREVI